MVTGPCCETVPPHERALTQRWVGRGVQIQALLAHLGGPQTAVRPVLVYGGPATGKTAVVRYLYPRHRQMPPNTCISALLGKHPPWHLPEAVVPVPLTCIYSYAMNHTALQCDAGMWSNAPPHSVLLSQHLRSHL